MIYFQPLLGVCTLHCSLSSHLKCGWWKLSDSWYCVKNIIRADKSGHENACFSLLRHQEDVDFYTDISCVNQKLGEINLALMDFPTRAHLKFKRHTLNWKGTICIRSRKKLVTASPGAICPYCAWQCSKGHHKRERTAWNADPAPEEGVCGGTGQWPGCSHLCRLPDVYTHFRKALESGARVRPTLQMPDQLKPLAPGLQEGIIPTMEDFGQKGETTEFGSCSNEFLFRFCS